MSITKSRNCWQYRPSCFHPQVSSFTHMQDGGVLVPGVLMNNRSCWGRRFVPGSGAGLCMAGIAPWELALCGVYQQVPMHPLALHGPKFPPKCSFAPLVVPIGRVQRRGPGGGGLAEIPELALMPTQQGSMTSCGLRHPVLYVASS